MKITQWENIFQRKCLIFIRQIMQMHFHCIMWVEFVAAAKTITIFITQIPCQLCFCLLCIRAIATSRPFIIVGRGLPIQLFISVSQQLHLACYGQVNLKQKKVIIAFVSI